MDNAVLINPIKAARDLIQSDIDGFANKLQEAEVSKKENLAAITLEMEDLLKMVYSESAAKRNAVEAKFSEDTAAVRNSIAEARKKLFSYERAIESLTKLDPIPQGTSISTHTARTGAVQQDDGDIPSETIYDAVIHILYNNLSSGLSYTEISQVLVSRGFIPAHKNPINVCANVLGTLKGKSYIDKVNDRYMLTDSQEADYRRKLSRTVFSILSNEFDGKTASLKEVVACLRTKIDKRRLPDDINRRVRGILIGLKLQGYVEKNYVDGQEYFAKTNKIPNHKPVIEQETAYSP